MDNSSWLTPVRLAAISAFAVVAAITVALALVLAAGGGDDGESGSPLLTAGIIDQLNLTVPNQEFVDTATETLEDAGYAVDYYSDEEVTVDFYRTLPQRDYDLILFRVHSTSDISRGDEAVSSVSLFTNQPYSEDGYREEQASGAVGFASYTDDGPRLFGITANFVESSMEGRFDDTMVIVMGCDGLKNDRAARAFLDRGASTFISWSDFVLASHTDTATKKLLEHLLAENHTAAEAVSRTNDEVGPDPVYGSELRYRPVE